jgi:hypothetical protein
VELHRPLGKNAAYLEVLGNGGAFSWNYERRISERTAFRIGFASWSSADLLGGSDGRYWTFPITVTSLRGGGGDGWEFGGGLLLGRLSPDSDSESGQEESESIVNLTGVIGYRFRFDNGLLIRAGFTPFLALVGGYPDSGFMPSVGLSIGWAW